MIYFRMLFRWSAIAVNDMFRRDNSSNVEHAQLLYKHLGRWLREHGIPADAHLLRQNAFLIQSMRRDEKELSELRLRLQMAEKTIESLSDTKRKTMTKEKIT